MSLDLLLSVEVGSDAVPNVTTAMERARGLLDRLGTMTLEELLMGVAINAKDPRTGAMVGACKLCVLDDATQ